MLAEPDRISESACYLRAVPDCSENEALLRIGKAVAIASRHQNTLSDTELLGLGVGENECDRSELAKDSPSDGCFRGIEELCGVKIWFRSRTEQFASGAVKVKRLVIMGLPPDVEFAHALYDLLDNTITSACEEFSATTQFANNPALLVSGFGLKMAARLNARLLTLAVPLAKGRTCNGAMIKLLKAEAIMEAIASRGIKLAAASAKPAQRGSETQHARLGA